jgi:PLP dependent protein
MTLTELHCSVQSLETQYSRPNGSIKVLAVSKYQSIEKIQSLYHQGQHDFGENYLQEALSKIQSLQNTSIEWHFIGHIQRNKTREIAEHFSWVQSLDRAVIAERLNEHRPDDLPPLQVLIEINASNDRQKSGISLQALPALITCVQKLPHLKWRGLMTMITSDYEKVAEHFFLLQQQGHDIDTLSMGMSQDYPHAIACGATMIRMGTGLFGERKKP